MKGIISTNNQSKLYNKIMERKLGFIVDLENDCYIKENYGAYMGTLPTTNKLIIQNYLQLQYYQNLINKGYKIILGPPAIDSTNYKSLEGTGLYCQNYEEFLEPKRKRH